MPSTLVADTLSSVAIAGAWSSQYYATDSLIQRLDISSNSSDALTISLGSQGVVSYQKIYRTMNTGGRGITYPLLMAIIFVDSGNVVSVLWDDTCNWCSSDHCSHNTMDYAGVNAPSFGGNCWLEDHRCYVSGTSGNTTVNALCDLRVYVVWTGTDSEGKYLSSAAGRFSRIDPTQLMYFTDEQMRLAA